MSEFTTTSAVSRHWRITVIVRELFTRLTKHHSLQQPVHVGMFAGSLLQRDNWDH